MRVFVLLYNARKENEGIHSLQIGDRNVVLMFESEDDATRYALLLEAQDFMVPTVEGMEKEDIQELDYEWVFVPAGFVPEETFDRLLLAPPETNLEKTDWQPEETKADLAESELDRIRRQLEGLL